MIYTPTSAFHKINHQRNSIDDFQDLVDLEESQIEYC